MRIHIALAALLVAALPQAALADEFTGVFALEGHYSSPQRSATQVTLHIQALPRGGFHVERVGEFPGQDRPAIRWTSTDVRFQGRTMVVLYRLPGDEADGTTQGIMDRLGPSPTPDDALAVLGRGNTIKGAYFLSASGDSLREVAVNTTRLGDERWWRWVKTNGRASVVTTVPPAVALGRATRAMRSWYLHHIRSTYANKLAAPGLTPTERADLEAGRRRDMERTSYEIKRYNYVLDGTLYELYDGFVYHDAQGEPVHFDHLQTYTLVFAPQYDREVEWHKPFVVDGRTGELLDTSSKLLDYPR